MTKLKVINQEELKDWAKEIFQKNSFNMVDVSSKKETFRRALASGKIYVGDKHRYAWGDRGKEPNTAQGKLIDMIEKSGTTIPVRPGGISRTALSPQQVHRKRKVGNVKTNMKDGKIVSKVNELEPSFINLDSKDFPTKTAEFNAYGDPEALSLCLNHFSRIHCIDWQATLDHGLDFDFVEKLFNNSDNTTNGKFM